MAGKEKAAVVIIDLKRFFQADGLSESFSHELDLSGMELGGVKPFCAPVRASVTLTAFGGSVLLRAEAAYTLTMPCDRCFETVSRTYAPSFSHTLVQALSSQEEDGDLILVPDGKLHLDDLLREDILLDLPGKFLCREDCKGLCPACGQNLNEGSCTCTQREVDPRLAVLQELL